MARGRMINSTICMDKRVNRLSDDTCRLLFTWLVPFADVEGRTYGDPAVVRSWVFPRRTDISIEQVDGYLNEMHNLGLIVRYEVNDELYIWFPNFDKNQAGLRKEREAASIIPPPPDEPESVQDDDGTTPDNIRQDDGVVTEQLPVKLKELNLTEQKGNEENGKGQVPISSHILSGEEAWESIKRLVEPDAPGEKFRYRAKVDPCEVIEQRDNLLRIRAPDPRVRAWLSGIFDTRSYQLTVANVLGEGSRIEFV